MSRRDPRNDYLPPRRRGGLAPFIVGTGCFAVVLATIAIMASHGTRTVTTPVTGTQASTNVGQASANVGSATATNSSAAAANHAAASPEPAPAGLAPAVEGAARTERELIASIALDGAPSTLSQRTGDNPAARREPAGSVPSLGGGNQADFESLIDLIQSETSGPWEATDGNGGTIEDTGEMAGIFVNPNGLLVQMSRQEANGRLANLARAARGADANSDVARPSRLRLVSLTRLEREVARRTAAGEPIPGDLRHLAGLAAIRFVFVYPEQREIVIAGPAEGWRINDFGNPVGTNSGHPILQLDDLVTVLRCFSSGNGGIIGCSIDPRPEGLKKLQQIVAQTNSRGSLRAGAGVRTWVNRLKTALGEQDISITGVPADSRVARVLVEADYKMKLIGIGKLDGGAHVPSIFDLLSKADRSSSPVDALRWWLSMKYDSIRHSTARDAFQLVGSAVLCQSENQFVNDQGQRIETGKSEGTNRRFAENFTRHYEELARRDTVFADLKNIFDLSLVAALVHHQGLARQVGWDQGVFSPDGDYHPASHTVPRTVESVVNHRVYDGRDVVVQVAGGVRAEITPAITGDTSVLASTQRLNGISPLTRPAGLPDTRWWWDLKVK